MNKVVIDAFLALKEAYECDSRYLSLKEKEKVALENAEVRALHIKLEEAVSKYEELLKYKNKDDEEVKKAFKAIYEAKNTFDNHPLVLAYTKAYSLMAELDRELDSILFLPYRKKVFVEEIFND